MRQISADYFNEEMLRFRDMMGDSSYLNDKGIETLDQAFQGLAFVYLNLSQDIDPNKLYNLQVRFEVLMVEWQRRKQLMLDCLLVKS